MNIFLLLKIFYVCVVMGVIFEVTKLLQKFSMEIKNESFSFQDITVCKTEK